LETSEALVENERALRMLADAVPQIICTAGPDGKVDYFNRRWFEFTGLSEDQTFENDGWLTAFHPEDRSGVVAGWREAARDGSDFSVEARLRSQTGEYRWFLERAVALRTEDGSVVRLFATATDINETKRVEEREKFLSHVSEVLGSTLDPGDLLQKITELCVPTFADWCQVQSLTADNELVVEAVRHSDPKLNARLESLVGRPVVFIHDTSLGSPHVLHKAHSAVLDHEATMRAVHENVLDPEDRAIYEAAGLGTCLIVPLIFRGQTRGTLHLVSVDPASRRPEITLDIAEELAHRAALAIDNSRQYEREHRVATALQHALLPTRLPSHPRIDLSYAYRPAERESRIGGDWYDAFAISEGRVAISIGDVAGHGLEASVAMNEARQALRLSALEGLSPAQTLRRANAALMLDPEHPLITAIYGVIDVDRSTFRYSCAGHPPPALVPLCGRARYLEGGGIPLGVEQDVSFPAREVTLKSYATLLLYTDGLIEFDRNLERESLRLLAALSERVHDTSADGAGALLRHVLNNRQLDDIAVLAATILPAQPEPVEMKLPAVPASATIARRFVSRFARVVALDADRSFDLALAVGEAVANAIEHAYQEAPGDFMLRLSLRDDTIFGEVQDLGSWREPCPSSDRGRGLEILAAITRSFEVSRGAAGTTVAFAL
jgi:PAS domain S-box-containing protein